MEEVQPSQPSAVVSAGDSPIHTPMTGYLPKPSAVLFDFDDTLVAKSIDPETGQKFSLRKPLTARLYEQLIEDKLLPVGAKDDSSVAVQTSLRQAFQAAADQGLLAKDTAVDQLTKRYFNQFVTDAIQETESKITSGQLDWIDGAVGTLRLLAGKNIPVAIVTNSPQELVDYSLPKLLQKAGAGDLADKITVVGCRHHENGKPDTDTLMRGLKELGGKHHRTITPDPSVYYVGDSPANDLKTAHAMGDTNKMTGVLFGDDYMGLGRVPDKSPTMMNILDSGEQAKPENAHLHTYLHADSHADLQALLNKALEKEQSVGTSHAI